MSIRTHAKWWIHGGTQVAFALRLHPAYQKALHQAFREGLDATVPGSPHVTIWSGRIFGGTPLPGCVIEDFLEEFRSAPIGPVFPDELHCFNGYDIVYFAGAPSLEQYCDMLHAIMSEFGESSVSKKDFRPHLVFKGGVGRGFKVPEIEEVLYYPTGLVFGLMNGWFKPAVWSNKHGVHRDKHTFLNI